MEQQSRIAIGQVAARLWLLAPLIISGCATADANKSSSAQSGWTEKLSAPFKASAAAVAKTSSKSSENRQTTANDRDELSLINKPNKKNPQLIVAMAQMSERSGKNEEAETQYKKAIKIAPKDLPALTGYAHLMDRQNKLEEATKLYQKAIAAHPKEAAVHNDLGLCYHRQKMLKEANASLTKAVELAPERHLYHNNLAIVQVDQGQYDAALAQLTAANGAAAGHYNLGYLLAKKGDEQAALAHFRQAAVLDPNLTDAQQWIAKLTPAAPANGPMLSGPAITPSVSPPTSQPIASIPPVGSPITQTSAQRIERTAATVGPQYPTNFGTPPKPARAPQYLQANSASGSTTGEPVPSIRTYPPSQEAADTSTAAVPPSPGQRRQ